MTAVLRRPSPIVPVSLPPLLSDTALREIPARSPVGRRGHPSAVCGAPSTRVRLRHLRHEGPWTADRGPSVLRTADCGPRTRLSIPSGSSAPRIWRCASGATVTWRRRSIRLAPARSAIPRSSPRPTASPKTTCGRCRATSSPARSPRGARRSGTCSCACATSTARRRATTSPTSSSSTNAAGCAKPSRRDVSAGRPTRSIRSRCSIGRPRSRPSKHSCTGRFPARRGFRSKASTCSCRSSTRSSPRRRSSGSGRRSSAWRIAAG